MKHCPKCGSPAEYGPPDGDFHYVDINKSKIHRLENQLSEALKKIDILTTELNKTKNNPCCLCQGTGIMPGYHDVDDFYQE